MKKDNFENVDKRKGNAKKKKKKPNRNSETEKKNNEIRYN